MATSYPSGIDNFTNPSANDYEDVVSHSGQHSNANDAIEAIETTLGTTAGTAVLKNLSAGDFAAKTANETFSGTTSFAEIDIGSSTVVDEVLDEDDMASDSATALVTQQSVKAYVDADRNLIINSGFTVNQRVYVSNAVLAAGAYGHDRWKAGASGGDYTFTQLNAPTQITIKSGKSLIQVVENINVEGGDYTLSWEGTAQARFGKDSATPSGSYAASPITVTGQAAGTVMSVEFNEGTLGKVVLTKGTNPAQYYYRRFDEELRACRRYYFKTYSLNVAPGTVTSVGAIRSSHAPVTNTKPYLVFWFSVPMRTIPTVTTYSTKTGAKNVIVRQPGGEDVPQRNQQSSEISAVVDSASSVAVGDYYQAHCRAEAEL